MNKQEIIDNFVIREFNKDLKNWFIIQDTNNSYMMFNKFKIIKKNNYFKVINIHTSQYENFFKLKNAVTYCICEKLGKYYDSNEVKNLDRQIENHTINELIHKKLYNKQKDHEQRDIYFIKLNEDTILKSAAQKEMDIYINISRYWLNKKLNELTK